jgi:hypothetical protein
VVSRCRGVQDIANSAPASFVKVKIVLGPASEKSVRPRLEALSPSVGYFSVGYEIPPKRSLTCFHQISVRRRISSQNILGAVILRPSAPFVATLVGVTGLVIYFNVASLIQRGTLL